MAEIIKLPIRRNLKNQSRKLVLTPFAKSCPVCPGFYWDTIKNSIGPRRDMDQKRITPMGLSDTSLTHGFVTVKDVMQIEVRSPDGTYTRSFSNLTCRERTL